jgi:4-hydroxy-tetrahydrodipicolinate synthase
MKAVFSPVVTPFRKDLSPDAEKLASHCRWLLANDVGLAVFGTNSEANSMSVAEKIDLLDYLVDSGIDPARMMPGTGCCALTDTVTLTAAATRHRCRGVLMLPPFYYKGVSDEGLFRSFAEVIERVGEGVRIYLYNIPPVSQIPLSVALIARLVEKYPENVVGIKDSSGDWNNTKAYLDNFATGGFEVFPGAETFLLQGLRNGGYGCISATANVNPGPISRLCETWESDNADEEQASLDIVRKIFASYPMIPALKAAIAHFGNDPTWTTVRPPLVELSGPQSSSLIAELQTAGFTMPLLTAN